mgnify:FL=1
MEVDENKRWLLQYNVHGMRSPRVHEIVWVQGESERDLPIIETDQIPSDTPSNELGSITAKRASRTDIDVVSGRGLGRGFVESLARGYTISV